LGFLWIATLIWAFSFSLIGVYLSGTVDSYFAVLTRTLLASLVFLPVTSFSRVSLALATRLMMLGGVQLGIMYLCLYQSFAYLSVPEVVLFTIFTPIYITLQNDCGGVNSRYCIWWRQ
jgi:drug/metabolite transporter (DMT)-like permease